MQAISTPFGTEENAALLRSVAEQLKSPLTTIARQAELSRLTGNLEVADLSVIQTHATAALHVVDSYLLGLQLIQEQHELPLEPVSVSSTLTDIAHELHRFAKQYNATLELCIDGRYEPVMAHRTGLRAALLALGYALLVDYPADDSSLRLAVHRTARGIVTGLYGHYPGLTAASWRQAQKLQGRASQPFTSLCGGSGAGFFVADAILQAMATRLRIGKHDNHRGFAVTLQPSQQLHFV